MATFSESNLSLVLLRSIFLASFLLTASANFYRDAEITWGDGRGKIVDGGRALTLSLDRYSGSGFQSKNEYLFGRFDLQLKLVPGNSAGTVTTFFLSSQGTGHDEIDFEFLGNSSGEPYTIHTNVYTQEKEIRNNNSICGSIRLLLSTLTLSSGILNASYSWWTTLRLEYTTITNQLELHFRKSQPMRIRCSLWNADQWATQGGRVKTDWTKAPFVATYRNFNINGCVAGSSCGSKSTDSFNSDAWKTQDLDPIGRYRLRWVQQNHMIYNYCTDYQRFPQGVSAECKLS
ncbi:hypothetical protein DH2020_022645 [Rehmannia glutinosa]|uniref:Xyloglucan endotransglucosylase/hydrolase n=1 Tax=Rehmannia glutinosa TaxID=99300 RepID=A0ABR0W4N4_REHGL